MKDVLVDTYFYTHIFHLLDFNLDDMVSFDIKYIFFYGAKLELCFLALFFLDSLSCFQKVLSCLIFLIAVFFFNMFLRIKL